MNLKSLLNIIQPKEIPVIQITQRIEPVALEELLKYAEYANGVYVFPDDLTVAKLLEKLKDT